jgi:putative ABC transport system permease protein
VIPLHKQVTGDISLALWVLMAAVGLVLLIACANVANLLLAKATSRQKEIAIRTAIGATRMRVLRQLLTESMLLGVLGGVLGLLFAIFGARTLVALVTNDIPRLKDFGFDKWALLFTLGVSIVTALVFGLAPALDASKVNLNEALKEGGRSSGGGSARNKLRSALVIAEVALAVVLVTACGLMFRSFLQLQRVNPGFNPANLVTLEIELPEATYQADQQQRNFQQQLLQKIRTVPGVVNAATVDNLPFSGNAFNSSFIVEGRPIPAATERSRAYYRVISPDYFSTMGIQMVRGNPFTDRDTAEVQGVAIINDVAARKFWPGEDPLGKKIKRGRPESKNPWVTIVGIVGSGTQNSLRDPAQPEIYTPYLQNTSGTFTLVTRTSTDARTLAPSIRKEVWATDKDLPVSNMKLMDELIANSVAQPRFYVILLSVFAGLALVLAAVGVYGVMSYSVLLRTRDIGIRMALGARPIDIFKHVLTQALVLALIGLGIGLVLAVTSTRVLSSMLYGISATDPITLAATALVLLVVALLASYLPARRATKVDPMVSLRYE